MRDVWVKKRGKFNFVKNEGHTDNRIIFILFKDFLARETGTLYLSSLIQLTSLPRSMHEQHIQTLSNEQNLFVPIFVVLVRCWGEQLFKLKTLTVVFRRTI